MVETSLVLMDAANTAIPIMNMGPMAHIAKARDQPFENPSARPDTHIDRLKMIWPNFSPMAL